MDLNIFLASANSLMTISCGIIILYFLSIKKLQRSIFYYGWSIGFILYGIQILLRVLQFDILITSIPMVFSFILFQFSTWALDGRKELTFLFLPFIFSFFFMLILFLLNILQYGESLWIIGSTFLYLPVTMLVLAHRKFFGNCVDKLLIGWFSLFLINVLIPMGGWVVDAFAIFCKVLILAGIMSYDFAIITQKIRSELGPHIYPFTIGNGEEGGLRLVMFRSENKSSLTNVSNWLKSKIEENIRLNVETNIIVLQSIIPYSILRSIAWSKPELVHFFIFSRSPEKHEEFTALKFGKTELGATITEIARKQSEKKQSGEIILIDLSILIHTFGARQIYSLLLNKMGILRLSGTLLTAVFHPDTHEESVVALFKTIADTIIQI